MTNSGSKVKKPRLNQVRSIVRGLDLLRLISLHGPVNVSELAERIDLPYPSIARIAATLFQAGYLEREPETRRYRVSGLVQALAHGYQAENRLAEIARPLLIGMTQEIGWPVLVATPLGSSMIVRDSTHTMTSLTLHHYYPGFTFPMIDSACGRAYLAFCNPERRKNLLAGMESEVQPSLSHATELAQDPSHFDSILRAGFAARSRNMFTEPPGKNSSIAAPLFDEKGVCGALALVFFASTMSLDEADLQYSEIVMKAAKQISSKLAK